MGFTGAGNEIRTFLVLITGYFIQENCNSLLTLRAFMLKCPQFNKRHNKRYFMDIIQSDVAIIGAGGAGLRAAIEIARSAPNAKIS